jgi:hypothetical protein
MEQIKEIKWQKSIQKTIPRYGFLKPAKKPEKNGAKWKILRFLPDVLKLGKIQGLDLRLLPTVNTNTGHKVTHYAHVYCGKQWGGSVCGSWGKGIHLGDQGARPSRMGKGAAVGSRQRRRRDVATWPLGQETDSPQLQETVIHRVSIIVHCTAIV